MVGANEMYLGGDIFPSGHTANAVVTWGVLAYLATTSLRRRTLSVIAALGALGVGMTTVYLGTHWVSDVLLGWAAGLLVLLAMPWLEPGITWFEDRLMGILLRLWLRLRPNSLRGPLPAGALAPGVSRQRIAPDGEVLVREAVPAGTGGRSAGHSPDSWPHHPARPYTIRSERAPVTPAGTRRPPHADRMPRTTPLSPSSWRGRNDGG